MSAKFIVWSAQKHFAQVPEVRDLLVPAALSNLLVK